MKIGLLWKNDYPWDVRVEKMASALIDAGHQVTILAANSEGRAAIDAIGPLAIRRLPAARSQWLNRLRALPFYLNPVWFGLAARVAQREKLDLLIVRDLPLITVGVWLRARRGLPLVLDMAENYPALYRGAVQDARGVRALARWWFKNPSLMAWVERWALARVDHVLVVVEESAQRLRALGVAEKKIAVVSNTPRLATLPPLSEVTAQDAQQAARAADFRLVYVGFVQDGRGLEVMIAAVALLRAQAGTDAATKAATKAVRCTIVGDGEARARLQALAQQLGVSDLVEFAGWVAHQRIGEYIHAADVGVIPHTRNEHTDSTIPNKLFDYMAHGKAVLVSDAKPLARIVQEQDCGAVFLSSNAASFAGAVERLRSDPAQLRAMGARGAHAVHANYLWEHDARVLCARVAQLDVISSNPL